MVWVRGMIMKNIEIECVRCRTKYPIMLIDKQTGLCPVCRGDANDNPILNRFWF